MIGMLWKSLVVVGCTVILAGCGEDDQNVQQNMQNQNAKLTDQNRQLSAQVDKLNKDVSESDQKTELANNEAEKWHKMYEEVKTMPGSGAGVSPEVTTKLMDIARTSKHWEFKNGSLRAQSDTFFEPGKAELKPEAKAAIAEVAPKLIAILADKSVVLQITGYTDADPIKKTANLWKDNRHLSMMRAYAVAEALKEAKVPDEAMVVAGGGQYHPVSNNPKDKDKNRRVELTIVSSGQ